MKWHIGAKKLHMSHAYFFPLFFKTEAFYCEFKYINATQNFCCHARAGSGKWHAFCKFNELFSSYLDPCKSDIQQMNKIRKKEIAMRLKQLISDIWVRRKNLGPLERLDEKNAMPSNGQREEILMDYCTDGTGLFQKDGMSTATARFIIERNVGEKIGEVFDVKDLKNTGRYYIAKIVRPDGSVIEQLLVDKQNCTIHFPKGRFS